MGKKNKTLIIFIFISSVLIAELIWWIIFTHQNNELYLSAIQDKYQLEKQLGIKRNSQELKVIKSEADRKLTMFISESAFVFVLILVGIYMVYRSFQQELRMQDQQQNFLLSITHELKTPLASMKLYLQTLSSKKNLSDELRNDFLSGSLTQVERLSNLINQVLESTKENFTEKNRPDVVCNIAAITIDVSKRFKLGENNVKVSSSDILFHIHQTDFELILSNLLKNAVLYSNEEAEGVFVILEDSNHCITLKVLDTGIGVPDDEKKEIFSRFYRVGSEDTRKSSGTGLGLFIVKQLVHKYSGKISVGDNEPKGSIFTLEIPKVVKS